MTRLCPTCEKRPRTLSGKSRYCAICRRGVIKPHQPKLTYRQWQAKQQHGKKAA